jgi:hypothetical protein
MSVEIQILSGARQGQRLEISAEVFQAGDNRGCEVFFDPQQDPGARSRQASFRLKEDGWYLASSGGGDLLVNERPVIGIARIRSGDVVRLSERGPDFSFHIVARPGTTSLRLPQSPAQAAPAQAAQAATIEPPQPLPVSPQPATPQPWAASQPGISPQPAAPAMTLSAPAASWPQPSPWAVLIGVGVAATCALVFLAGLVVILVLNRGPATPQVVVRPADAAPVTTAVKPESKVASLPPAPADVKTEPADVNPGLAAVEADPSAIKAPAPITDPVFKPLSACVYLLGVEDPQRHTSWPFASAVAIRNDTLLTSATVAVELARFRQLGMNCWAHNQPSATRTEIGELRVYLPYQTLSKETDKRLYFDFALITVPGKLPKTAVLAAADALGNLEAGTPLVCLGIPHGDDPINRFQSFAVELSRGKVFAVTTYQPPPGPRRMMHVRAVVSPNIYGSPVFTPDGKIVGVYSEPAPPLAGQPQADLSLHYVPVVATEVIQSWLDGRGGDLWVPPVVPPSPAPSKSAPPKPEKAS